MSGWPTHPETVSVHTRMQPTNQQNSNDSRFQKALERWRAGDSVNAETLLTDLLAHAPTHRDGATLLAKLYQTQGRLGLASEIAQRHCRETGLNAEATLQWAQFIQQCQRQGVAVQLCEEAIRLGHGTAALFGLTGNLLCELGRFDDARDYLFGALERGIDLNQWFVFGALAGTRRYSSPGDPDIARINAHFRDSAAKPQARAASGFALAKIHDDLGDYASAAQTLREANALARQALPWSRSAWREWISARIRDGVGAQPPRPGRDFIPVFVVGMPRTGTTLTSHRLGRHADVRERGELPHIGYIARRLSAAGRLNDPGALHEAANLYAQHVRQDDAPARWYIDKNPENIRYLDLIAAMFPEARIIACRRDPADTAMSMWSQYFANPDQAYSYDFDDIAAFMAGNSELHRHWQQRLSLPLFTLDYEQLVTDVDATLARLCEFIGLDADSADAQVQSSEVIASNSRWQARQPVYRSSVGRWQRYLPFVSELQRFSKPHD